MKKIAIITLNGYFNYGNRLQNYALQKFLEKISTDSSVTTIWLDKNKKNLKYKLITSMRPLKKIVMKNSKMDIRHQKFIEFSNDYINESKKRYNIFDDLGNLDSKFDYFVIGSDQVWNPYMNGGSGAFFADFADPKKRISYAASFGLSSLPDSIRTNYTRWINSLEMISVREDKGAEIVKQLTGKEAEVLVDPTLLLGRDEWVKVSSVAPRRVKTPYLLTYFLGELPANVQKDVEYIKKKHNLEVINLGDESDRLTYETGPSEFLDYINNCSIFLTDSFHGCVFSIIFKKPFIVYERQGSKNMFSRIATLLEKFNLESRSATSIDIQSDILNVNFESINNILEIEKIKSEEFLKKALNIKQPRS